MFETIIKSFNTKIRAKAGFIENDPYIAPSDGIDYINQYLRLAGTVCKDLEYNLEGEYRNNVFFQICFSACQNDNSYMSLNILMQVDINSFEDTDLWSADIPVLIDKVKGSLDEAHNILLESDKHSIHSNNPKIIYDKTGNNENSSEYVHSSNDWSIRIAKSLLSTTPSNIGPINLSTKPDNSIELAKLPNTKSDIIQEDSLSEVTFYLSDFNTEKCTAIAHIPNIKDSKKKSFPISFDHSDVITLGICHLSNTAIVADTVRKVINNKGSTRPDSFQLVKIKSLINRSGIPTKKIQNLIDEITSLME